MTKRKTSSNEYMIAVDWHEGPHEHCDWLIEGEGSASEPCPAVAVYVVRVKQQGEDRIESNACREHLGITLSGSIVA